MHANSRIHEAFTSFPRTIYVLFRTSRDDVMGQYHVPGIGLSSGQLASVDLIIVTSFRHCNRIFIYFITPITSKFIWNSYGQSFSTFPHGGTPKRITVFHGTSNQILLQGSVYINLSFHLKINVCGCLCLHISYSSCFSFYFHWHNALNSSVGNCLRRKKEEWHTLKLKV